MLMKIVNKENDGDFLNRIAMFLYERHFVCDLFDLVFTVLYNKIDVDCYYDAVKYTISYAYGLTINGRPRVINAINSKKRNKIIDDFIKQFSTKVVKTTELWVSREDGIYEVENLEEVAAHAPRLNN